MGSYEICSSSDCSNLSSTSLRRALYVHVAEGLCDHDVPLFLRVIARDEHVLLAGPQKQIAFDPHLAAFLLVVPAGLAYRDLALSVPFTFFSTSTETWVRGITLSPGPESGIPCELVSSPTCPRRRWWQNLLTLQDP